MANARRVAVVPELTRSLSVADVGNLVAPDDELHAATHIRLVAHSPGAAVLLWGQACICLAFNRQFRAMADMRTSDLGRPFLTTHPGLDRHWRKKLECAMAGSGVTMNATGLRPKGNQTDGSVGWLVPVIGADASAIGTLGVFMDRPSAGEPMRRLMTAVATDLREPLVGIQVATDRMARAAALPRERFTAELDRVAKLTRRMDGMIDDMHELGRRGLGHLSRVSRQPGDLGAIVQGICAALESKEGSRVSVSVVPVDGLWDAAAIRHILTTLVASARQCTGGDGDVRVEVISGRDSGEITVLDEGPVVSDDQFPQLFEPWSRGSSATAERRRRGHGLGLLLGRELIEALGGDIAAVRPRGGGFGMRVSLPRYVAPDSDRESVASHCRAKPLLEVAPHSGRALATGRLSRTEKPEVSDSLGFGGRSPTMRAGELAGMPPSKTTPPPSEPPPDAPHVVGLVSARSRHPRRVESGFITMDARELFPRTPGPRSCPGLGLRAPQLWQGLRWEGDS